MIQVRFDQVKVGDEFFDQFCGESFKKLNDHEAVFARPTDKDTEAGVAAFCPDELVEIYVDEVVYIKDPE